ncbi:Hsp70 family protein [Pseudonocardia sp.]|uniref:Hsp70 family protein n=1 Tax=Pseudonocardia sp. TaxID=60912 RepID=UPI0031FCC395
MRYGLGVDLGTSSVAAAVAHAGGSETVMLGDRSVAAPVVVHADPDGTLTTGDAAERRATAAPDRTVRLLRRRLGEPTPITLGGSPHRVTELLAAVLRDVVAKVESVRGGPPDQVVLSRPAHWGPTRVALLTEVARLAGLPGATTITEPEAAAIRYGEVRALRLGELVAVYDLGGGTFDAAVLRRGPRGMELAGPPEGIERLGGTDFDDAILTHLDYRTGGALSRLDPNDPRAAAALARLRAECVLAKESLSVDAEADLPVYLPDRHEDLALTRVDLEAMMRAPIESTVGALMRALRFAQVPPAELRAVVLVGGATRIPLVARMVSEGLGGVAAIDPQTEQSVALGAASVALGLASAVQNGRSSPGPGARGAGPYGPAPQHGPAGYGTAAQQGPAPHEPAPQQGLASHGPAAPHGGYGPAASQPHAPYWPAAQPPYGPAAPQAGPYPGQARRYGPPARQGPTPRPSDPRHPGAGAGSDAERRASGSGEDGDWHVTSIGRTLATGVALLAVAVAVAVIVFVLLNRIG